MRIKLGPFCTCVWAVLNFTWAVFDTIVGRFGFGPFWSTPIKTTCDVAKGWCGGAMRETPLKDDGKMLPLPAEMVDTDVVDRELAVQRAAAADDVDDDCVVAGRLLRRRRRTAAATSTITSSSSSSISTTPTTIPMMVL